VKEAEKCEMNLKFLVAILVVNADYCIAIMLRDG